ncbi:MAG: type II toxin-antitoxin system prevent-host-death family antitoxin [Deltaproteobacteria bacterium]|nr:type II toxin-antitoxin system prevent-host-death family antitoxin [Deltaproteobacteria bacterium]
MTSVSWKDAQGQLARWIDRALRGEDVVVDGDGDAKVRLVPVSPPAPAERTFGLLRGRVRIPDDFDAALPPDALADFEGR